MKRALFLSAIALMMMNACQYDENKSTAGTAGSPAITQPSNTTTSTHNASSKNFPFTNFTQLEIGAAFKITLTQAPEFSVVANGNTEDLEKVNIRKDGSTLKIGMQNGSATDHAVIELVITMPNIEELETSGVVEVTGTNTFSGNKLSLDLSGSSAINMNIDVQKLDINGSGATELNMSGKASQLKLETSGTGTASLIQLAVNHAGIEMSGATSAQLNVAERMQAEVSGTANIVYKGNPSVTQEVSGAASIKKI